MKKIIIFGPSKSIHTQRWVEIFRKNSWKIYVISFTPEKISGVTNIYLNVGKIKTEGSNYKYFKKYFKLIYLIYTIKPHILNPHYLSSYGLLAFMTLYPRQILNLHGTDVLIHARLNLFNKFIYKIVLKRAKHIISVSSQMTSVLTKIFQIKSQNITTMQYGIDIEKFTIQTDFRARQVTFVCTRAFVENSNYPLLVEIFSNLRVKFPNISAVFVGDGPQKTKIKGMIKYHSLEHNVKILDAVDHNSLIKILNSAKIFISLTSSDGTPLSLFEAIACGLFPVISNIDANRDWINKGIIGEVLDFTNSDEMTRKLIEIILRLDQIEFVDNNRRIVIEHMDFSKNSRILNDVFIAQVN